MLSTSRIRLEMAEASRQALPFSPWVSRPVKVGKNADASAPPATRLKSVSETRLAALKASISACVPKAPATRTWRSSPVRLLSTKATITVPAARAIWRFADEAVEVIGDDYIRVRRTCQPIPPS